MDSFSHEPGEQWMEELVGRIGRGKLVLPALLLLEITRPFSFLVGQGLLLCQPLLGYFIEEPRIAGYANLMADRSSLDRLVTRLEQTRSAATGGGEGRG